MTEGPTIIIPARYGSTRLPGKMLCALAGKPVIHHTIEAARRTGLPVILATDDERIAEVGKALGVRVAFTGDCANGTERCARAAVAFNVDGPVVNWQGDSPLVPADWIRALLAALEEDDCGVSTPVQLCTDAQARGLRDDFLRGTPGGTAAVVDSLFRALYFSKAPVPLRGPFYLHVGVYAYSRQALARYGRKPTPLEQSERLEQLRFLERGIGIQCVPVSGDPIWEVNNFADLAIVERLMGARDATVR